MTPKSGQQVAVWRSRDVTVSEGVATGDGISFADELVLDDIYQLSPDAEPVRISLTYPQAGGTMRVAEGSAIGRPGNAVALDCAVTLISRDGLTFEALVLVEVANDTVAAVYLLPLAQLVPKEDYRLVGIDRDTAAARFAEVACVAFTRGTHITLASGEQRRIEDLSVGDRVLTRDDGPQEVRWIGASTVRAVGDFAPVLITEGTLHNENDLILSPDHRILIYQRNDALGAGRAELLIRVSDLVNGTTVRREPGGFIEYFQLLFDRHQIIYAEGIAAESLLIDTRTRPALPKETEVRLAEALPGHADVAHLAFEVQDGLLDAPDVVELLRRASSS